MTTKTGEHLDAEELALCMNENRCPDCGHDHLAWGAIRGTTQKIKCPNLQCGSQYCLVEPPFYFERLTDKSPLKVVPAPVAPPGLLEKDIRDRFKTTSAALFALEEFLGPPGSPDRAQVYRLRVELGIIEQSVLPKGE